MKKGKKIISLGIALLALIFGLINQNLNDGKYRVVRVVDGDTLIIEMEDKEERVRLIGVDTPESVHPDASKNVETGKIASDFTKSRLEGEYIELEFDVQERDRYGRILAYVWHDGEMYNKVLLREGYAQVATFPPNVKYVDLFTETQLTARNNKVGFWNDLFVETSPPTAPIVDNKHDNLTVSPYSDRLIKGNISSSGEKIFHAPGQRDYKKTVIDESKGERWFATESEAINAGWRKAKR